MSKKTEYLRKYRAINREKVRKWSKNSYIRHAEEIRAKIRNKRKLNPKKALEYDAQWRKKNYDKLLEYRREWRYKNRDRLFEVSRAWRKRNMKKLATIARLRYQRNPQKELDRVRFKKYGITGEEYRTILEKQGIKCPICSKDITRNLSVDHNHTTGKIRGFICNKCNLSIGNAEDSPDRLRAMADYLEKTNA